MFTNNLKSPTPNASEHIERSRTVSEEAGEFLGDIDEQLESFRKVVGHPSDAEAMLMEARVNMAFLQRFAEAMVATSEGRCYLNLLCDTAAHAYDWATAHCHGQAAS